MYIQFETLGYSGEIGEVTTLGQDLEMGKKGRSKSEECENVGSKNVNPPDTTRRRGEAEEEHDEGNGGDFFACYLLTSLSPRSKDYTYIGFTVNPKRRIKQHNGEMTSGAFKTKSKRPWEMALCIYGFPTNTVALQFEWAWQHPTESLAVREAASKFKSFSGIANKVKLAFTMLTLPSWQSLDLTVNFFSTKYQRHCAGCPRLPEQMNIQMCSMDELPCYTGYEQNMYRHVESVIEKSDGLTKHNKVKYVGLGYIETKETLDCSIAPSSVDCRSRTEKMTPASALNIDRSGLVVAETFQGSIFPQGKSCSNEMVSPAGRDMPNMKVCRKDEVLIKDPIILSNVEVVDLSTPESGCTTSLQTKRRRTGDSKFIDLTKSPIFV